MKKLLLLTLLSLAATLSLQAQEAHACILDVQYIDPTPYINENKLDYTIQHPPAQEEQYLFLYYYHQAKKQNAPDELLNELARNAIAFYNRLKNPPSNTIFDWTAEKLGWQTEAVIAELQEKNYLPKWE